MYTGKNAELAVGGIPAKVAIRSQMIPLRIEKNVNRLRARQRGTMPTLPVSKGGVRDQMCHRHQCAGETIQRA